LAVIVDHEGDWRLRPRRVPDLVSKQAVFKENKTAG
jgi:hypothetical protein